EAACPASPTLRREPVRSWSLATLAALGLAAGGAPAASPRPTGTYKVTITGKPAPLNGRWRLRFLQDNAVHIVRNGKTVVFANATFTAAGVKFSDRSGSYPCGPAAKTGAYMYRVRGRGR